MKIFEDSLRISSPGQLPFDMPMEFLMNPAHPSRPRNKIIAQAFFDMGIIERYGSGIKRIKGECDKNGNPYPEWSDLYGEFATTYRPRTANGEIQVNNTAQTPTLENTLDNTASTPETKSTTPETTPETKSATPETTPEKILLAIQTFPEITVSELSKMTGLSIDGVKWNLRKLKSIGKIRRIGYTKGGHWEVMDVKE
ncbi:MAG: winged helix-turn-helix transcriptional regulator [Victivallales bacterium]|nr:winged helix-turn-helix transcriptional regulator [Victivallales bacterium]